ncbi:MAG: FRG domain-containing protein [Acidobacteria bacterium]|nr:FRG domain-containing protein [Acidobacteriota bacterium]MBV9478912.1 FRG domain-containing protein [Acidobacteriota bacterium]
MPRPASGTIRARNRGVEIRVSSWAELQDAVFDDAWQPALSRHRSNCVFRGVPRARHALATSLQTGGFEAQERHLLTSFRKYALRSAVHGDWVWNWLSVAKHHGLPTRLLDWTYSPLVAMHFATHDIRHFDEDAAIWCVDYRKTNELLPKPLRKILDEEDVNLFTTELLNRAATTLSEFDTLAKHDFVVFFEPPSLDERIVNQFALFSLPSSPTMSLQSLLEQRESSYRRIIIPAALKWEVRDKLDQANVTERVLFPGLDGLSQWLKRYFTTRPGDDEEDRRGAPPAGRRGRQR